jgi:predicted RND superfamily exporter protein
MEYDLLNLRTDMHARAEEVRLNILGDNLTGHVSSAGMAILVDKPEQVPELKKVLDARRDQAPADLKPFDRLHALQDFVPANQDEKIPTLLKIRKRLVKAHERGALTEADWKQIEGLLPPEDLKPFTLYDLPEGVARAFTEGDGTRGRIVYISPTKTASVDDAHYLFRWSDSYREAKLPDGSLIRGSGRAVIYADMWASVVADVPIAVLLSFAATLFVVAVAFRGGRASVAVVASLLVGVAWMLGLMVVMKVKLNFLNFIALPITFGIGVDYAVNVVQRYTREGPGSALIAIRETGGAVILCSLTTTLGYLALVRSTNYAVRSLGVAAFIGEVCCLLASVLVLPAVLVLLDKRRGVASRAN